MMLNFRQFFSLFLSLFLFLILFSSCGKDSKPEPQPPDPPKTKFAKGADMSWITEMEGAEIKFYNSGGAAQEGMSLLKSLGANTIRLRVWVSPFNPWNNPADVLAKAIRAKDLGMRVMIDFHYSDTWADPGHQTKPVAWTNLSFADLKTALANHTKEILNHLRNGGVVPEWVQVGNETNDGLLWPEGKASTNMANYAQLITAGYDAVKSVFPQAKVIVHVSNGWDNNLFRWNIGGLVANNAKFDVIGMSLYPDFVGGQWITYNQQCLANMKDMVATYQKEVMLVEVGMSWDQPVHCRNFLADLIAKVKSVPGDKGLGVLYWEPQSYRNWKGYTLGAFDDSGKPTEALNAFSE